MDSGDLVTVLKYLWSLDWSLCVGLTLALVFLPVGACLVYFGRPEMQRGEEETPAVRIFRRWRSLIIGFTFLLLGCWAAGGASRIASGVGNTIALLVIALVFRWAWRRFKDFGTKMPIENQVYHLRGIGRVTIESASLSQMGSDVRYRNSEGEPHSASALAFYFQSKLVEDNPSAERE